MQIQCPKCKGWTESDSSTCPLCGNQLGIEAEQSSKENITQYQKNLDEYKRLDQYRVNPDYEDKTPYSQMCDDAKTIARQDAKKAIIFLIIIIGFFIFMLCL